MQTIAQQFRQRVGIVIALLALLLLILSGCIIDPHDLSGTASHAGKAGSGKGDAGAVGSAPTGTPVPSGGPGGGPGNGAAGAAGAAPTAGSGPGSGPGTAGSAAGAGTPAH